MRLDDVLNLLGRNRDYVILALAVLVLVEGAIIVLWARRASLLRRELSSAVADAEASRSAALAAAKELATPISEATTYRVAPAPRRELYPVSDRTEPVAPLSPLPERPVVRFPEAPAAHARPEETPAAAAAEPAPEPQPPAVAEPPAEYVSPVVQQAAAWVLPEVEASHGNGNGNGNGAHPAPTALGWSGSSVPVEPAADFAVLSGATEVPPPPSLTVLPAIFDTNDDATVEDDLPTTGDVLLVEDDETIAKLYRLMLESRGYTVRHAVDGVEGLDRVFEKRPDLVLLDIMMPRMNGIAFLQALRSGPLQDVRVVVLSNFMEKQLVDDALSLGALEYMVKAQTRPEALVGALPHWLRGERAFSY